MTAASLPEREAGRLADDASEIAARFPLRGPSARGLRPAPAVEAPGARPPLRRVIAVCLAGLLLIPPLGYGLATAAAARLPGPPPAAPAAGAGPAGWAIPAGTLLSFHLVEAGWAPAAHPLAPSARLAAKPAYQSGLAAAIGDWAGAEDARLRRAGIADPDLRAASRLLGVRSGGTDIAAAGLALDSFARRVRRNELAGAAPAYAGGLGRPALWAALSAEEIAAAARGPGPGWFSPSLSKTINAARGRAAAAVTLLSGAELALTAPEMRAALAAAIEAWEAVEAYDPFLVLGVPRAVRPGAGGPAAEMIARLRRAEAASARLAR